ncbi:class I SAM-dependent methyltransferase [Mycolicibacterium hodleri]|uniref:Methyltransferase domain-containing protein n=1 Tax=Mycolicibacterium hodleri TaxID=49897 RepID=A0A502DWI2_9MYCO|nr:methyltransferase domain-containing protein [Mycolicibacterium hodleri]TPG29888.1 methyltransferase domain-containing protein [Mycolicibacterium hodleri]
MTTIPRRRLNQSITRFWSFAAPVYDQRCLQRLVYQPAQDEMIAALRANGAHRIVDIACGTGILASRIADELLPEEVYGVDMSDGMLAQARGRSSSVAWKKGPAEQLPFADGFLDAVVTTSAFHFFDQPAALREFHRVLAPGGLVAVATISPRQLLPVQLFAAGGWAPVGNPSPAQMRDLFEDAGFTVRDQHRVHRPVWTQAVGDLITIGVKP